MIKYTCKITYLDFQLRYLVSHLRTGSPSFLRAEEGPQRFRGSGGRKRGQIPPPSPACGQPWARAAWLGCWRDLTSDMAPWLATRFLLLSRDWGMCSLVSTWSLLPMGETEALLSSPDGPASGPILSLHPVPRAPAEGRAESSRWDQTAGVHVPVLAGRVPAPGSRWETRPQGRCSASKTRQASSLSSGRLPLLASRSEKGSRTDGNRTEPGV